MLMLFCIYLQPPNGTAQGANSSHEKKAKIQEQLRTIRLLFKRLRLIYEKCNENCQVPVYNINIIIFDLFTIFLNYIYLLFREWNIPILKV